MTTKFEVKENGIWRGAHSARDPSLRLKTGSGRDDADGEPVSIVESSNRGTRSDTACMLFA